MAVRSGVRGDFLRKRVECAFFVILVCYLALVARLLYLQGAEGPMLRAQATQMREQRIPLAAHRGSICDRDGRPLAVSLYSGTVGFDPSAVQPDPLDTKKAAKMEAMLSADTVRVAALLHLPLETLQQAIRKARAKFDSRAPIRFVPIARDVPLEVAQGLRDMRPRLIGFGIEDGSKRVYSSDENAAQVVGFMNADGTGAAGLERACRHWLDGRTGFAVAEVDDRRREIPDTLARLVSARDGLDVHTTLDANAQEVATEEAERVYARYHPIGVSVVVLDPITGDVIALVSLPTFDPNPGHRGTLKGEALAERCATRLYEPGSTLKALTIATALEDHVIGQDSTFFCGGQLQVGNKTIHCVLHGAGERNGHGVERPIDILRHSCNIGAAQIGLRMGPARLFAGDRKFGLLDPLDVGLPGEQHGRLSFDKNEKIYTAAKAARVAFGHSITTTPLHVALAYAAIANGGLLMKPRLITSVTDSSGQTRERWEPKVVRRVISPETSAEVCAMLRAVVSDGTGKIAAVPGYQVAGKTGTAQKYRKGAYVGSFIGFLPASPHVKPRAVILVTVDEPHGAYYGAEVAAPAFQAIARRLAAYWRIPEDDPEGTQYRVATDNMRRAGELPALATR